MTSRQFVTGLKSILKLRGLTYQAIAKEMGVSESSVKRWFSTGQMSLEQYSQLLSMANISFHDLAKLLDAQADGEVYIFSHEQELFLANHSSAHAFLNLLLRYSSVNEVIKRTNLSRSVVTRHLRQLDSIGLIEWQEGNKYRLLVSKKVAWRKDGPLRRQFLAEAKNEFLQSNFSGNLSGFRFLSLRLTEKSIADVIHQFSKITGEVTQISELEKSVHKELEDVGILMAVRPWTFSKLVL